jgi:predicted O-methyltransferase YrrM
VRRQNEAALRRLRALPHPGVQELASALDAGLRQEVSPEEATWITSIEDVRQELESSTELLRTSEFEWSGDRSHTAVLEETVGECCRTASKRPSWTIILFRLIRSFQPVNAVELGTCLGVSAAYQGAALDLNGAGELSTFEASSARIAVARRTCERVGVRNVVFHQGRFQETLAPALARMDRPVDYAFIDGHHEEQATLDYFEQIAARSTPSCLVVFDDIHWSDGMDRAWDQLVAHDRIAVAVDAGEMGICLLGGDKHPDAIHIQVR